MSAPETRALIPWLYATRALLAKSPPTDVAERLSAALVYIQELAQERDDLKKIIGMMQMEEMGRSLDLPPPIPVVPDAPKIALDPAISGMSKILTDKLERLTASRPRVWQREVTEHHVLNIEQVRDRDGDYWRPADPVSPLTCTWILFYEEDNGDWTDEDDQEETRANGFQELIARFGPIVDWTPGAAQGAWYATDEDEESPLASGVRWVTSYNGEDTWVCAYNNKWRSNHQTDEGVKVDGYSTFQEILSEHGAVFYARSGFGRNRLSWVSGEPEPHESIESVKDPTGYYWARKEPGSHIWFCPAFPGAAHAKATFGTEEVEWSQLLAGFGRLEEYFTKAGARE